ncbi:unnamed protein product [Arabis nemorensis]|uniref:Uncharacterized protein n=1 Tax=Arabis nemorensis TaxID=586526 RepID=A0A565CS80_9BRAS|nr:unnamed protein product [Arabis nemorensis]
MRFGTSHNPYTTEHFQNEGYRLSRLYIIVLILIPESVTTFSEYCFPGYYIFQVIYDNGNSSDIFPDLAVYDMEVPLSEISSSIAKGLSLELEESKPASTEPVALNELSEHLRSEVGYNNIPPRMPASIKPNVLNELTDLLRIEIAMNVYTEVMTFT